MVQEAAPEVQVRTSVFNCIPHLVGTSIRPLNKVQPLLLTIFSLYFFQVFADSAMEENETSSHEECMDVNLINPFIEATLHVLSSLAFTKANAGKPYLKQDALAFGDVSGIVGLTGETSGTISVSFSEQSILAIVGSMFGEPVSEINDEVKDAVGEILNIVSGQARQKLEARGRLLKGAIPTVITGKNHTICHITKHPIIAIPFETDNGNFTIEVCLEE
jgi:chemotaxis protein CheX